MNDLIASYLVLNGECSLPGIGKFSVNRSNAVCDVASKELLPPAFNIQFSEAKSGDPAMLVAYIASNTGSSASEATEELRRWTDSVNTKLTVNHEFELPFIGKLVQESNGAIHLKSGAALHVFNPVKAERVVHEKDSHAMVVGDKISSSSEMNELLSGQQQMQPDRLWRNALIIFTIAVLLIILYFISDGFGLHLTPGNAPATYISK